MHEQLKPSIAMFLITTKILQDCYGFHRCILYVTKQNLNAELQRIARRDNKAFLSEYRKETEEGNRMGRLDISSRKWEISKAHLFKDGHDKGQKQ